MNRISKVVIAAAVLLTFAIGSARAANVNVTFIPPPGLAVASVATINEGVIAAGANGSITLALPATAGGACAPSTLCDSNGRDTRNLINMGYTIGAAPDVQVLFAGLPSCTSALAGATYIVTNSTAIASEGQVCAGGSTHIGVAICADGNVWKCF
jgi:hypothetical protein